MAPLYLVGLHSQVGANPGTPLRLRPGFGRRGLEFINRLPTPLRCSRSKVQGFSDPGRLFIWYRLVYRRCKCVVVVSYGTTRQGFTGHRSDDVPSRGKVMSRRDEVEMGSHTRSSLLQGLSIMSLGRRSRVSSAVFCVRHRRGRQG